MRELKSTELTAIYACFFLSGAVGLSYEVLWTRILSLSFGHSTYALTTTVTAFMTGLALGSYLLGRLADRMKPLRLYALLELGVGFVCLGVPHVLDWTRSLYLPVHAALRNQPEGRALVQFLFASAVLVIPAFLMGGTLPALSRALTVKKEKIGPVLAVLYSVNTLGAAVGAFAAAFLVIPALGMTATNHLGAGLNLFVGVVILILFRNVQTAEKHAGPSVKFQLPPSRTWATKLLPWALVLSGGISMLYQVAWVRALTQVIGTSTYALSAILVTFLMGLGLGSYLFAKLRRSGSVLYFAWIQIGIALAALPIVPLFNLLPGFYLFLFEVIGQSFPGAQFVHFFLVMIIILPPTIFMGMTLPCVVDTLTARVARAGRDVGRYSALSTIGAIGGTFLTGFALIPIIGARKTLSMGIILNLLIAAGLMIAIKPKRAYSLLPALAVTSSLLLFTPGWNKIFLTSGVSIYGQKYMAQRDYSNTKYPFTNREILFFQEGITSNVAVDSHENGMIGLLINGKYDGTTHPHDLETEVKLAYLPMLLHPEPQDVAVIGLGTGVTAGVATLFKDVQSITVIEIERAVKEASGFFDAGNFRPLDDPRVEMVLDDARSYFQSTGERFDVVISEPSNPWIAGIANLFSIEFMREVKEHLTEEGVFCLWLQGYNIGPDSFRLILRSFFDVFPHSTMWEGGINDYLIIGSNNPPRKVDLAEFKERIHRNPLLVKAFDRFGDQPLEGYLTSFRLTADQLESFAGDGPLNTDDRNLLEFHLPKTLFKDSSPALEADIRQLRTHSVPPFISDDRLKGPIANLRLAEYLIGRGRYSVASWQATRFPPLWDFKPSLDHNLAGTELPLQEDFEGDLDLALIPMVGPFRPDETDHVELSRWEVNQLVFSRKSGVLSNGGRNGKGGLVLAGLENSSLVGYKVAFPAQPDSHYEVSFALRNLTGPEGRVTVGFAEYGPDAPAGRQLSRDEIDQHLIEAAPKIRMQGNGPWQMHTFDLKTSQTTGVVHLVFILEGDRLPGSLHIDDIRIQRIASSNL
jgi:spermidine synthase